MREGANEDPDAYDCTTCPVAQQYDDLAQDTRCTAAWHLWRLIATQFAFDANAVGIVFDRLTREYDPDAYADMLQRMAILYQTFYPPKGSDGA